MIKLALGTLLGLAIACSLHRGGDGDCDRWEVAELHASAPRAFVTAGHTHLDDPVALPAGWALVAARPHDDDDAAQIGTVFTIRRCAA
jgi:hypothetical protein